MPQGDKHRLSAKKRQGKKCQAGRLAFCLVAFFATAAPPLSSLLARVGGLTGGAGALAAGQSRLLTLQAATPPVETAVPPFKPAFRRAGVGLSEARRNLTADLGVYRGGTT